MTEIEKMIDQYYALAEKHLAAANAVFLASSEYERSILKQDAREIFLEAKALGERIQKLQAARPFAVRQKPWEIMP